MNDNVVSLADRVLGECPACRRPVLFAEDFVRAGRAFVHLACTVHAENSDRRRGGDFPKPAPPHPPGA